LTTTASEQVNVLTTVDVECLERFHQLCPQREQERAGDFMKPLRTTVRQGRGNDLA